MSIRLRQLFESVWFCVIRTLAITAAVRYHQYAQRVRYILVFSPNPPSTNKRTKRKKSTTCPPPQESPRRNLRSHGFSLDQNGREILTGPRHAASISSNTFCIPCRINPGFGWFGCSFFTLGIAGRWVWFSLRGSLWPLHY